MQTPGGAAFQKAKVDLTPPPKMLGNQISKDERAEVGRIMKAGRLAEGTVSVLRERRDGHLVGHIAQDTGFKAFNSRGCYVGTYPMKQPARRSLERKPVRCENQLPLSPPTPSIASSSPRIRPWPGPASPRVRR